jgi:hypothetical protein
LILKNQPISDPYHSHQFNADFTQIQAIKVPFEAPRERAENREASSGVKPGTAGLDHSKHQQSKVKNR